MERRNFLKRSAAGLFGMGAAATSASAFAINPTETYSNPTDLRITDIRGCMTRGDGENYPIIKIYTNQDVYGLGEVRDSGRLSQAFIYKSYLVGKNPMDIETILKSIKPMAGNARNGGVYSAIDMALMDIVGKVLGVPCYRLLGSKRRSKITAYADTPSSNDIDEYQDLMKFRLGLGFKNFKMDLQKRLYQDKPGAINGFSPTNKGFEYMGEYVAAYRDVIGYDKVLGADHFGYLNVDDGIRLGKAMEKYSLATIEDVINYDRPNSIYLNQKITESSPTPTLNGEDLFGFDEFRPWIDNHACDIIHPDMETSGGIIETKKICDYAALMGVPTMFHFAGSPVGCIASLHCACLLDDFISMENHAIDTKWWGDMVKGVDKPIIKNGEYTVPEKPGLGVELNDDVLKEHLIIPGYFEPTKEFDKPMVGTHFGVPVDAIKK